MKLLQRERGADGKMRLAPYEPAQPVGREIFVFIGRGDPLYREQEHHAEISGVLKIVENALDAAKKPSTPPVIGVEYSKWNDPVTAVKYYKNPDTYISQDAQAFVDQVLMPRLLKDEEKPSVSALQERISKITLVTHSYGCIFTHQVCNGMRKHLEDRGYSQGEISKVCHSVAQISTSCHHIVHAEKPTFTTLLFRNTDDKVIKNLFAYCTPLMPLHLVNPLEVRKKMQFDPPKGSEDSFSLQHVPCGTLVFSPIPKTMEYEFKDKRITIGKHGSSSIKDICHAPHPHWYCPIANTTDKDRWPGDSKEPDNTLAVKLKTQALYNAIERGPKEVDPVALMMTGNMLTRTERMTVEKQLSNARQVA